MCLIVYKKYPGSFFGSQFFLGYLANSSAQYVVNWTMPHCVLCLRLIAQAIDVYDGSLPEVRIYVLIHKKGIENNPSNKIR